PHPPGPGLPSEDPSVATVRRGREGRGETGRSAESGESRREMPASSSSADGSNSSPSSGRREPDPGAGEVRSQGSGEPEGAEEGRTSSRSKSESTPSRGSALPFSLEGRELAELLEKDSSNWPSVKSAGASVKSNSESITPHVPRRGRASQSETLCGQPTGEETGCSDDVTGQPHKHPRPCIHPPAPASSSSPKTACGGTSATRTSPRQASRS